MKLYKNVSKMLLMIKTPRRMAIDPGMVIDVANFNLGGTDLELYIKRGVLIPLTRGPVAAPVSSPAPAPKAPESVKPKPTPQPSTNVPKPFSAKVELNSDKATVVSTEEEKTELPKSKMGTLKNKSEALVVETEQDEQFYEKPKSKKGTVVKAKGMRGDAVAIEPPENEPENVEETPEPEKKRSYKSKSSTSSTKSKTSKSKKSSEKEVAEMPFNENTEDFEGATTTRKYKRVKRSSKAE